MSIPGAGLVEGIGNWRVEECRDHDPGEPGRPSVHWHLVGPDGQRTDAQFGTREAAAEALPDPVPDRHHQDDG